MDHIRVDDEDVARVRADMEAAFAAGQSHVGLELHRIVIDLLFERLTLEPDRSADRVPQGQTA